MDAVECFSTSDALCENLFTDVSMPPSTFSVANAIWNQRTFSGSSPSPVGFMNAKPPTPVTDAITIDGYDNQSDMFFWYIRAWLCSHLYPDAFSFHSRKSASDFLSQSSAVVTIPLVHTNKLCEPIAQQNR